MMDCCGGGMMAGMWLMGLLWLVIVAGGIGLVVWAIFRGRSGGQHGAHGSEDTALAVLRNRFASGEINEVEYRERRMVLDTSGAEPGRNG